MTKKLIYAVVSLVLFFTVFALVGCGKDDVDKGLKTGFEVIANSDESPAYYCAYSSDVSEFDIDNVSLKFYYGGIFNPSIEHELENGRNIPYVELYFENTKSEQEPYFIKKTEDSYVSEKYRCDWIVDEDRNIIGIDYNHHENITIPAELFVSDRGKIAFSVFGNNINDSNYGSQQLSSIWIYYTADGDKVTLSEEEIE